MDACVILRDRDAARGAAGVAWTAYTDALAHGRLHSGARARDLRLGRWRVAGLIFWYCGLILRCCAIRVANLGTRRHVNRPATGPLDATLAAEGTVTRRASHLRPNCVAHEEGCRRTIGRRGAVGKRADNATCVDDRALLCPVFEVAIGEDARKLKRVQVRYE